MILILSLILVSTLSYQANPKLYTKTNIIYKQMKNFEQSYPDFFKIKKCPQDQDIWYATLGEKTRNVKAILTCGAHARQLLSSDVCLNFLKDIVKKWDEFPDLYLLVVPVVNKNRDRVIDGELCLRVNERGVDPNRNYPVNFQKGSPTNGTLTYRGPYPLSEKWSQCIDEILASEQKWNMILDIHTGQLTLFYAEVKNETLNKQTRQLLQKMKKKYCPICLADTIQNIEGHIQGQMFKYAATKYQVEHSLQFQIYGGNLVGQNNTPNSCMKNFSPNNERARDFFLDRWVKGTEQLLRMILELKRNP